MMRIEVFVCAVAILNVVASIKRAESLDENGEIRITDPKDNPSTCTVHDAEMYAAEFHNCFIDKKYGDGGRDLSNIVDRILEHARVCIKNVIKDCRPNYKGFMVIMGKVIYQMKDYCHIYLEHMTHERSKVKDLQCVEESVSTESYRSCFKELFAEEVYASAEELQQKLEKAISCTNKSHKLCSKAAKTSLNRMVRTILRVKQPEKEDIEDDVKPEPPKKWYDYIIQPFVSLWKSIKSLFGS